LVELLLIVTIDRLICQIVIKESFFIIHDIIILLIINDIIILLIINDMVSLLIINDIIILLIINDISLILNKMIKL
jgi:hypothetical protein